MVVEQMADVLRYYARGTGTTTSLVGVLFQNPKAHLFVASEGHRNSLIRQFPILNNRIHSIFGELRGMRFDGPVLLDTPAILALLERAFRDGQKDGAALMKAQMSEKWSEEVAEAVEIVLKTIAPTPLQQAAEQNAEQVRRCVQ